MAAHRPVRREVPLQHIGGLDSAHFAERYTWPEELPPDPPVDLDPNNEPLLSPSAYPFFAQSHWGRNAPPVEVLSRCGAGSFGAVFLVRDSEDQPRALRVCRNDAPQSSRFLNEIYAGAIMRGHDAAVRLQHAQYSDEWLFILSEYSNGSIVCYLARNYKPRARAGWERQLLSIVRDLFHALALTHAAGLIHRDVQPGSIFQFPRDTGYFGSISAALGKWGSSEALPLGESLPPPRQLPCSCPSHDATDEKPCSVRISGKWGFQPPELLGAQRTTHAADIWSAGMVVLSLVQPQVVAELFSAEGYLDEIRDQPRDAWFIGREWLTYLGGYLRSVVEACLHPEPEERPSAADVVRSINSVMASLEEDNARRKEKLRKLRVHRAAIGSRGCRPAWLGLEDITEESIECDLTYISEGEITPEPRRLSSTVVDRDGDGLDSYCHWMEVVPSSPGALRVEEMAKQEAVVEEIEVVLQLEMEGEDLEEAEDSLRELAAEIRKMHDELAVGGTNLPCDKILVSSRKEYQQLLRAMLEEVTDSVEASDDEHSVTSDDTVSADFTESLRLGIVNSPTSVDFSHATSCYSSQSHTNYPLASSNLTSPVRIDFSRPGSNPSTPSAVRVEGRRHVGDAHHDSSLLSEAEEYHDAHSNAFSFDSSSYIVDDEGSKPMEVKYTPPRERRHTPIKGDHARAAAYDLLVDEAERHLSRIESGMEDDVFGVAPKILHRRSKCSSTHISRGGRPASQDTEKVIPSRCEAFDLAFEELWSEVRDESSLSFSDATVRGDDSATLGCVTPVTARPVYSLPPPIMDNRQSLDSDLNAAQESPSRPGSRSSTSSTWVRSRPSTPPPHRSSWRSSIQRDGLESYPLPLTPLSPLEPHSAAPPFVGMGIAAETSTELFSNRESVCLAGTVHAPLSGMPGHPFASQARRLSGRSSSGRSINGAACPGLSPTLTPSVDSTRIDTPHGTVSEELHLDHTPAPMRGSRMSRQISQSHHASIPPVPPLPSCSRCWCPSCNRLFAQMEELKEIIASQSHAAPQAEVTNVRSRRRFTSPWELEAKGRPGWKRLTAAFKRPATLYSK